MKQYHALSESIRWRMLVEVAKAGIQEAGYTLVSREPGRGLSNVWNATKGKAKFKIAIKTTQDRAIAFPPMNSGKNWKTLDNVDMIAIASTDSKTEPTEVEVHLLKASVVRDNFNLAYKARTKAGQKNKDGYGMWVSMNPVQNEVLNVGAGFIKNSKPVATYPIEPLLEALNLPDDPAPNETENVGPANMQDLVDQIIKGIGQRLVA